jgi:hypothetical protein
LENQLTQQSLHGQGWFVNGLYILPRPLIGGNINEQASIVQHAARRRQNVNQQAGVQQWGN